MDNRLASALSPLPPPPVAAAPSRSERPPSSSDGSAGSNAGQANLSRMRALTAESAPIGSFVSVSDGDAASASSNSRTRSQAEGFASRLDRPFSSEAAGLGQGDGQRTWLSSYTGGGGIVVPVQGGVSPVYNESSNVYNESGNVYTESNPQSSRGQQGGNARESRGSDFGMKASSEPIRGLYIAKTAVNITACYLAIQLLITLEEVLLPFIFAVLAMVILEPLKKFVMHVLYRSVTVVIKKLRLKACMETRSAQDHTALKEHTVRVGRTDSVAVSEGHQTYGNLANDSAGEDSSSDGARTTVTVPIPCVQKVILIVSISFCVALTGRVLWLTTKVFINSGAVMYANQEIYRRGSDRLKNWIKDWVHSLNFKGVDWPEILDDIVKYVEAMGSLVTKGVVYSLLQAVVSMIFLLYMLWSPIKMGENTTSQEVFLSTGRYLKVKCLISAFTGCCVGISLWATGLDLPAAFGFLAFLCNFLPGVGSVVASVLPCVLAIIDVRRTPTQVFIAFMSQLVVHFFIDFVVEPVFFGISVEIHSVIVILGIWFFCKVWGVAGMLLSVPLLAVVRLMLKSFNRAGQGRDSETAAFLDSVMEGRWMSSVGDDFVDTSLASLAELDEDETEIRPAKGGFSPWEAVLSSPFGQEVKRIYGENELTIDIAMLMGLVVGITVIDI